MRTSLERIQLLHPCAVSIFAGVTQDFHLHPAPVLPPRTPIHIPPPDRLLSSLTISFVPFIRHHNLLSSSPPACQSSYTLPTTAARARDENTPANNNTATATAEDLIVMLATFHIKFDCLEMTWKRDS